MTSTATGTLAYEVFINEPAPQDGVLPNGEPKRFSPQASTLIYGREDAVLTDPPLTTDQAGVLGDWIAAKHRRVTDIVVTHGHGDHWFAAGPLVERFGARVVAAPGTIAQMHGNVATRPLLWDKIYTDIPPTTVTATRVPDNRLAVEGHDLVIVEVGSTDSDDSAVLHVPDLDLVVAGDVIYNGVHMYLAQVAINGGFGQWRDAIDRVEALRPHHVVAGHQNARRDDDATRTIAETRQYLRDAEELLHSQESAVDFFDAEIARYPEHLGRTILWIGASVLYGARDHPDQDIRQIVLASWF
jgi:glyoxylase-like metal-dependent hydrolase (beta-lactamase superfamily II)